MKSTKKRILVVCPTSWEKAYIQSPTLQSRYEFASCCDDLFDSVRLSDALYFNVFSFLERELSRHRRGNFAGVLATGDYPGCMFGAYLAEKLGLVSAGVREATLLSHKWHSRRLQQKAASEATPAFALLNPLRPRKPDGFEYPFFVKPVKGTMSIRARMVNNQDELGEALRFTWKEFFYNWVLLRPFVQLQRRYIENPTPFWSFIAESPLYGEQVTVDGFVRDEEVVINGIVDSIMYPGTISFKRFEYPSQLPQDVQKRMRAIAAQVIRASGLNHSCFNVEMFYDSSRDLISIIEINPRMSYQFADLYERVDGRSSFEIQLELSTGEKPFWTVGNGSHTHAASFVMRRFSDARAVKTPNAKELELVEKRFPGTRVETLCAVGDKLSNYDQDVESFRYCIVNMAANSHEELLRNYSEVEKLLTFQWE
jgi:hypothetical protein